MNGQKSKYVYTIERRITSFKLLDTDFHVSFQSFDEDHIYLTDP